MPYKFNPFTGSLDETGAAGATGATGATGTVSAAGAGTAAAPSISFAADTDTGLFNSGANVLDITTGGTAKVKFDNTTAPLKEIFSSVYYPVATQIDIGTDPNQIPINGYLGTLAFQDSAAVNLDQATINTATISTATISSAAVTAFSNVPLLTGGGVKFPPTQVASADPNTLDDYEEGTWTPADASVASLTFTSTSGSYTKVGRLVSACGSLTFPTTVDTNELKISLPFTSANLIGTGMVRYTNVGVIHTVHVNGGAANFSFYTSGGAGANNVTYSTRRIDFEAIYYV